jgi:hypothetical protein
MASDVLTMSGRILDCKLTKYRGEAESCNWCCKVLKGRQRSWSSPDGRVRRRLPKHPVCRACGKCDRAVGPLECNHIKPRLGDKTSVSCLHHQANLEMLCHSCHAAVTAEQRSLWPKKKPKARKPSAA